jgi:RNA polymerase sigma factor (sigma-70 family)
MPPWALLGGDRMKRRPLKSNGYQPKGWAHRLEVDLREQEEDPARRRARRRHLKELDKKIQKAKGELWKESHKRPTGPQFTEHEFTAMVALKLGMSIDDYLEEAEAIEDMKESDALTNADSGTLFLVDLRKHGAPLLTREQEIELGHRACAGDEEATKQLVAANVRLVAHIAKRFRRRGLRRLLEYTELINAGVEGLTAAVQRFDPTVGTRLASFASYYIAGAICDELEKAAMIRLPRHVALLASKIVRAMDKLHSQLGRKPTYREIADHLGIEPEKVFKVFQTIYETSKPIHPSPRQGRPHVTEAGGNGVKRWDPEGQDAWDYSQRRSNNYRTEEEDQHFGNRTDEEGVLEEEILDRLRTALESNVLTKEELTIISKHFGLDDEDVDLEDLEALEKGEPARDPGKTLTRIARQFGMSKQWVSKVDRRALAKLRRAIEKARER